MIDTVRGKHSRMVLDIRHRGRESKIKDSDRGRNKSRSNNRGRVCGDHKR